MSHFSKALILAGAAAVVMGAGSVAARADEFGKLNANVRTDLEHIRRDKLRIHDLETKRHQKKLQGDYRRAGYATNDLDKAKLTLQSDKTLLARDKNLLARYHK